MPASRSFRGFFFRCPFFRCSFPLPFFSKDVSRSRCFRPGSMAPPTLTTASKLFPPYNDHDDTRDFPLLARIIRRCSSTPPGQVFCSFPSRFFYSWAKSWANKLINMRLICSSTVFNHFFCAPARSLFSPSSELHDANCPSQFIFFCWAWMQAWSFSSNVSLCCRPKVFLESLPANWQTFYDVARLIVPPHLALDRPPL